MANKIEYVYSRDGEGYSHQDFSDLIDSIENDLPEGESALGKTYYRGIAKKPLPSSFCPDADWVFEHMAEQAYDVGGEYSEDFPDCTKEQKLELETLIKDWCDKNITVTFYGVIEVAELTITAEDLEPALAT